MKKTGKAPVTGTPKPLEEKKPIEEKEEKKAEKK